MSSKTRRGVKEGLQFGLIAGVIFALVEMAGSTMMGNPPLMPLRMFASVVLGTAALETMALGTAILVGLVAHFVLSAIYGAVYGLINSRLSRESETRWGRQALYGLAFGVLIWFLNFQIVARVFYPWFLMTPQFLQMVMHAMFFGLPLALMYAAAERRVQQVHGAHGHA